MYTLNFKLAKEIVDRTMQIIPFNVNVMDVHGTIIASGDPTRTGQLHSGALLALAQKSIVEVDENTTKAMHGTKPGINLPLTLNGELYGAVGLSGPPNQVRQFGQLVKLTAEMILEQANLINGLQRNTQYREAFLLNLINFEHSSDSDLYAWGQRLNFDFQQMQLIFILEFMETKSDQLAQQMQDAQMRILAHQPHLFIATLASNEMVILDSYSPPKGRRNADFVPQQHFNLLHKTIQAQSDQAFVLSMGIAQTGLEGIQISYLSAKATSKIGQARNPRAQTHDYYELALPVLLSGLSSNWQAEQLRLPIQQLYRKDKKNRMLEKTLKAWFTCNENYAETANMLKIHRNSLDYRLKRIEDITGFNLKKTEDRLLLYVSSLLVD